MDVGSRYDGHAVWYDEWARTDGAAAMSAAGAALADLVPVGCGVAVDVGCGTGRHAALVRGRGYRPVGVDYSSDQLRIAARRLPCVRADARRLPVADASVPLAYSMLTHTDVECFDRVVDEAVRILAPGGAFVYVGVHPCFVNPHVEALASGAVLHRGYRVSGWQPTTPFTGNAVRERVGVHHLTLEDLLTAFCRPGARIERIVERGGDAVPQFIGVRLVKADRVDPGPAGGSCGGRARSVR